MAGRNLRLPGIDADQRTAVFPGDVLTGHAHRRDRPPCPALDDRQLRAVERPSHALSRRIWASVRVEFHSKSPNIKIFGRASAPHRGHSGKRGTARIVSGSISTSDPLSRKDPDPTVARALHALEAAVNFDDLLRGKARALEVSVDVGREDKSALALPVSPALAESQTPGAEWSGGKAPSGARRSPRPAWDPR